MTKKKKKRRKRKEKEECDEQNGLYECIYRNLINWYALETKELFGALFYHFFKSEFNRTPRKIKQISKP